VPRGASWPREGSRIGDTIAAVLQGRQRSARYTPPKMFHSRSGDSAVVLRHKMFSDLEFFSDAAAGELQVVFTARLSWE
jgi:hypothetical protein